MSTQFTDKSHRDDADDGDQLLVRQKSDIGRMVINVARAHMQRGFYYPTLSLLGGVGSRVPVIPMVKFGLSPDNPSQWSAFTHMQYSPREGALYFNIAALFELPSGIELFHERMECDPEFERKLGWIGKNIIENSHLFRSTSKEELAALVSGGLGEHLVAMRLREHPESWLHVAGTDAEFPDFAASMIKAGIIRYFAQFFSGPTERVSECSWVRNDGNMEFAEKNSGGLRAWYIEKCGYEIVEPLITLAGEDAITYLLTHKLDIMPNYQLKNALRYRDRAYQYLLAQKMSQSQ